jgi:hypothetical protein
MKSKRDILISLAICVTMFAGTVIVTLRQAADTRITVDYEDSVHADKPAMEYAESVDQSNNIYGAERSGHWPTVMHHFLRGERYNDKTARWEDFHDGVDRSCCRCCGSKENLNVHHITPFHLDASKECDPDNLVTLCRDHHFVVGHLRNWKDSNPNVCADCDKMRAKLNPNKK